MIIRTEVIKVGFLIPRFESGGVGTVNDYAARYLADKTHWKITLISLHDPVGVYEKTEKYCRLALGSEEKNCDLFIDWLNENPQDIIVSSDVSNAEYLFPYFPSFTKHVIYLHDSQKRYRDVVFRNHSFINGVICVSDFVMLKLLHSLRNIQHRLPISRVYNGADFPSIDLKREEAQTIELIFVGRVDVLKGAFDLIPILCYLRKLNVRFRLTIVGGENERLRRLFYQNNLEKFVVWAGKVEHKECYFFYQRADILLMLSRLEAFGMVTVEAMSMGAVPIVYDTGCGTTEVVVGEESGMIIPLGSFKGVADAVNDLYLDREKLTKLRTNSIKRARQVFPAHRMGEGLIECLAAIIDGGAEFQSIRLERNLVRTTVKSSMWRMLYSKLVSTSLRAYLRIIFHRYPRVSHFYQNR